MVGSCRVELLLYTSISLFTCYIWLLIHILNVIELSNLLPFCCCAVFATSVVQTPVLYNAVWWF